MLPFAEVMQKADVNKLYDEKLRQSKSAQNRRKTPSKGSHSRKKKIKTMIL